MRLFYILYTWLFFVPVFLVLTILTAVTTIVGCLLGGEKIFSYYPGMIWSRLTCYLALCPVKVRGVSIYSLGSRIFLLPIIRAHLIFS